MLKSYITKLIITTDPSDLMKLKKDAANYIQEPNLL